MNAHVLIRDSLTLGRVLRDARRARGWTQLELATRAGVAQPTVSNVERGAAPASFETLWRLLAALELDIVLTPRVDRDPTSAWDAD